MTKTLREDLHHLQGIGNTPYDNCTTRTNAQTSRSVPQPGVVLHWCATLTNHYQRLTGFTALQSCLVVRFRVLTLNLHGSQHLNFFWCSPMGTLGRRVAQCPWWSGAHELDDDDDDDETSGSIWEAVHPNISSTHTYIYICIPFVYKSIMNK